MRRIGIISVVVCVIVGTGGSALGEDLPRLDPDRLVIPEPGPGIERVAPMVAPWCKRLTDHPKGRRSASAFGRSLGQIERWGWSEAIIVKLAPYVCANPTDRTYQRQTAGLIQGWANTYGLTEKHAIAAITLRVQVAQWERLKAAFCDKTLGAVDPRSPLPERLRHETVQHAVCSDDWSGGGPAGKHDVFEWYYDRLPDAPSELARARFLIRCFGVHGAADPKDPHHMARYAMCGYDAELMDARKLAREIRRYNGYARTRAREFYGLAKQRARLFKAAARKRARSNRALRAILFDLPQATYRDWASIYTDNKPAIDAALAFEQNFFAPRQSATQGCWKPQYKHLSDYVARHKPKTIADVQAAATSPVAKLLTERLVVCAAREKRVNIGYIGELNDIAAPSRGWHALLMNRLIDELNRLRDSREDPFEPRSHLFGNGTRPSPLLAMIGSYGRSGRAVIEAPRQAGQVARRKAVAAGVSVAFKPVKHRYMKRECKPTRRIMRIEPNGNVIYYHKCRNLGMATETKTLTPTTIPAEFAHGIKNKAFVQLKLEKHVFRYGDLHNSVAAVYAVYRTPKKQRLVNALGFRIGK